MSLISISGDGSINRHRRTSAVIANINCPGLKCHIFIIFHPFENTDTVNSFHQVFAFSHFQHFLLNFSSLVSIYLFRIMTGYHMPLGNFSQLRFFLFTFVTGETASRMKSDLLPAQRTTEPVCKDAHNAQTIHLFLQSQPFFRDT